MTDNNLPIAVLSERIAHFDDSLSEVKAMVTSIDGRLRDYERREAGCQVLVKAGSDAAHRRLDEQGNKIDKLDGRIKSIEIEMPSVRELLAMKNKIIITVAISSVLGTTVGGAVIMFLFNLVVK